MAWCSGRTTKDYSYLGWSFPYTRRDTGENTLTAAALLSLSWMHTAWVLRVFLSACVWFRDATSISDASGMVCVRVGTCLYIDASDSLLWLTFTRTQTIHGLAKQTQFCIRFIALWSQNSFQTPQNCQLLNRSLFRSPPMYGHVSWVMTERVLSQVHATQMGFLRRVCGVTFRNL